MDKSQIVLVKQNIKKTYNWLSEAEIESCYNMALSDYVMLRYPSGNNRPSVDNIDFDFFIVNCIHKYT